MTRSYTTQDDSLMQGAHRWSVQRCRLTDAASATSRSQKSLLSLPIDVVPGRWERFRLNCKGSLAVDGFSEVLFIDRLARASPDPRPPRLEVRHIRGLF